MATQGPLGGIAFLLIDGEQVQLKGTFMVKVGGRVATGVAGQDNVHGYTEKIEVPTMSGDISDSGGVSLTRIQAVRNVPVTAELSNGKIYVGRGGWCQNALELDAAQAQFKIEFGFLSIVEQGA